MGRGGSDARARALRVVRRNMEASMLKAANCSQVAQREAEFSGGIRIRTAESRALKKMEERAGG